MEASPKLRMCKEGSQILHCGLHHYKKRPKFTLRTLNAHKKHIEGAAPCVQTHVKNYQSYSHGGSVTAKNHKRFVPMDANHVQIIETNKGSATKQNE